METEEQTEPAGGAAEIAAIFKSLSGRFKPGRLTNTTTFSFSIDDENWTLSVSPDQCIVEPSEPKDDADCSLRISKTLFLAILRGEYTPSMMDLISGKIKSNNLMLLAVLRDVFSD